VKALAAPLIALLTAANAMPPAPVVETGVTAEGTFLFEGALIQGGIVRGTAPAGTVSLTFDGKPVALAADGRFLLGLDRDQPETATLVAQLAGGKTVREDLAVAPRAWRIERVDVARRPSSATEDYLKLRAVELDRIAAARAVVSTSEGWRQRFIWPATGRISGLFGSQRIYRGEPGAYHSGVDIAPGAGAPVVAPADGIVVLAGPPLFSLEGNLVILDHGMGLNSAFLHLGSVAVHEGQAVRQGEPIGTVGASGRVTGPHLHWSMKWNDARLDPQDLAGAMGN
jgi:murein DD-endopeptidase MepM/ murein hydrolase activator NlpD